VVLVSEEAAALIDQKRGNHIVDACPSKAKLSLPMWGTKKKKTGTKFTFRSPSKLQQRMVTNADADKKDLAFTGIFDPHF
jgi:hypothetical protein